MKKIIALCLRRPAVFSLILFLSTVFSFLGAIPQAHAMIGCRGDPIIKLSNGAVLQAEATVAVDPTQLGNLHINYTFHVPFGAQVSQIIYTGGSLAGRESVSVYADQLSNSYWERVLATASYGANVTTTFAQQGSPVTATGFTNLPISLYLKV